MIRAEAYATLGVQPSLGAAELRSAYRRLLLKSHPDHGGSREQLERVMQAYALVKDVHGAARENVQAQRVGGGHIEARIPQAFVNDMSMALHVSLADLGSAVVIVPCGERLPYHTWASFNGVDEEVVVVRDGPAASWWVGSLETGAVADMGSGET